MKLEPINPAPPVMMIVIVVFSFLHYYKGMGIGGWGIGNQDSGVETGGSGVDSQQSGAGSGPDSGQP